MKEHVVSLSSPLDDCYIAIGRSHSLINIVHAYSCWHRLDCISPHKLTGFLRWTTSTQMESNHKFGPSP